MHLPQNKKTPIHNQEDYIENVTYQLVRHFLMLKQTQNKEEFKMENNNISQEIIQYIAF